MHTVCGDTQSPHAGPHREAGRYGLRGVHAKHQSRVTGLVPCLSEMLGVKVSFVDDLVEFLLQTLHACVCGRKVLLLVIKSHDVLE